MLTDKRSFVPIQYQVSGIFFFLPLAEAEAAWLNSGVWNGTLVKIRSFCPADADADSGDEGSQIQESESQEVRVGRVGTGYSIFVKEESQG